MLDKEQQLAASYIQGHSIIIAGAGCGKTTTLLGKVESLIKSGVDPDNIMVLSFTNETVNSFKEKCKYNIKICTFHKAALEFIDSKLEIADEYILDTIIRNVLVNLPIKLKKRIFKMYRKKCSKYKEKKYLMIIESKKSNSIFNVLKNAINIIKTNQINLYKLQSTNFNQSETIILYIVKIILNKYLKELEENEMVDFDSMITIATKNIQDKKVIHKYKHILVDEYQDISYIRLEFLRSLIQQNNSILTVVGDDYQSIYRFSGSRIDLFLNFKEYFPNAKTFYITNTYRCPIDIINKSNKFILKNNMQITKELNTKSLIKHSIKKIYYKNRKKILYGILKKYNANENILIISRNNYDVYKYINSKIKYLGGHFCVNNKMYGNTKFMSIHAAKGLEADIVIVLNLTSDIDGLPSKKENILNEKLLCINEPIANAEERRLFYVALTRTKKEIYLLIDINNPSIFMNEI